jgi:beta-glucanase (GH16 family)
MKKLTVFLLMLVFGMGAAYALPPGTAGYGLLWSDEFNGPTIDTTAWSFDTGMGQNNEKEFYSRGNFTMDSGALMLWARYNDNGHTYTSCRVNSAGKKEFKYGYFEARMKAAHGNGLWPAVWLLGASINHGVNWPTCGEMELYEARTGPQNEGNPCGGPVPTVAGDNCFIATCHYGVNGVANYHCGQRDYPTCLCDRYHTYGLLWDSLHVEYYFDDTLYWSPNFPAGDFTPDINQSANVVAFHSPFYWIMNVAVGGNYQGGNVTNSIFPQKMDIDYVRVYQLGVGGISAPQKNAPVMLARPATAQCKVYSMSGRMLGDFSNLVHQLKKGDDVLKSLSGSLPQGVYVVSLTDNGLSSTRKLVTAR